MKKLILYITMCCLLLFSVFASPTDAQIYFGDLAIETVNYDYHPINTPYYLQTHVFDSTSGVRIDSNDVNCTYYLTGERDNWRELDSGNLTVNGSLLEVEISASHFNTTQDYAILLDCENPTVNPKEGGFVKFYFTVYEDQKEFSAYWELFAFGIIALLIVLALVLNINILGIFTAIGLMILSLQFVFTYWLIGVLLLVASIFLGLFFAFRQQT